MFDDMVSEKAIEWLWILLSAGVVIFGLLMMFSGGGFFGFIIALLYIAIGLLVVRIICESMVLAFKMFENNRRSLESLEQIERDQSASRKMIQAFLNQATAVPATAAAPPAQQPPASVPASTPPPASSDRQASGDQEIPRTESRSKLGDWPSPQGNWSGYSERIR